MPDIKHRRISCLSELKPGDHIRVRGIKGSFSTSASYSVGSKRAAFSHHLMVVRVIDSRTIEVIHKTKDRGVCQERKRYSPGEITVLDYESRYTGDRAVKRAQGLPDEKYNLLTNNCEHFVFEARTGEKQCEQIGDTAAGGVVGGGAGAVAGGGAGAGVGAIIGAALGSVVPGAGTIAGGVVGGIVGGGIGAVVGIGGGAAGGGVAGLKYANKK